MRKQYVRTDSLIRLYFDSHYAENLSGDFHLQNSNQFFPRNKHCFVLEAFYLDN